MKLKAWIVALACAVQAAALAGDGGVGVGSGDGSRRDEYLNKLRREMGPRVVLNSKTEAGSVSAWCSRVSAILKRETGRAVLAIQRQNFELAEQILIDALVTAGESMEVDPDLGGPMTKALIDRGLLISEALDQSLCTSDRASYEGACEYTPIQKATKLNFLTEYVGFVLRAERELDQPWYIPYRYRYGNCRMRCVDTSGFGCWDECAPEFKFSDFQRIYVEYAREQLQFVARKFTDLVWRDGSRVAVPVGDPRAFLKVAELESAFVRDDLANNIYAARNACAISDLEALHVILEDYNLHGDRTTWPSERYAVAGTRQALDDISMVLMDCRGYRLGE